MTHTEGVAVMHTADPLTEFSEIVSDIIGVAKDGCLLLARMLITTEAELDTLGVAAFVTVTMIV